MLKIICLLPDLGPKVLFVALIWFIINKCRRRRKPRYEPREKQQTSQGKGASKTRVDEC